MSDCGGSLLLVGCGKMGGALLSGWLAQPQTAQRITVVEPWEPAVEGFRERPQVRIVPDSSFIDADERPDLILLALKPSQIDQVSPSYRRFVRPDALFLSIAAGKTLARLAQHLGPEAAIVRAMPNTPAAVGRGMTVACPNAAVSVAQRERADQVLAAVGDVAWIEDEALMDAVTAVSGSGPAYVFLLVEYLGSAAEAAGLPPSLAQRLARQTVIGAGELLRHSSETPTVLRENVTSPQGTTATALSVLMSPDGLLPLMTRAVAAAKRRSLELAS